MIREKGKEIDNGQRERADIGAQHRSKYFPINIHSAELSSVEKERDCLVRWI